MHPTEWQHSLMPMTLLMTLLHVTRHDCLTWYDSAIIASDSAIVTESNESAHGHCHVSTQGQCMVVVTVQGERADCVA